MNLPFRMVEVQMPPVTARLKRGDRLPITNPLRVGKCEAVVEDVKQVANVTTVDFEVVVDGVYLAKLRATVSGDNVLWSPLRMEERK